MLQMGGKLPSPFPSCISGCVPHRDLLSTVLGGAELEKCSVIKIISEVHVAFRISAAIFESWVDLYFRLHGRFVARSHIGSHKSTVPPLVLSGYT